MGLRVEMCQECKGRWVASHAGNSSIPAPVFPDCEDCKKAQEEPEVEHCPACLRTVKEGDKVQENEGKRFHQGCFQLCAMFNITGAEVFDACYQIFDDQMFHDQMFDASYQMFDYQMFDASWQNQSPIETFYQLS